MNTEVLLSTKTMALNEDRGHSNWYYSAELSGVFPNVKFERNQFVIVPSQTNTVCFLQSHLSRVLFLEN